MSEIKLENYKDIISDAYVYGLDEAIKASKYPMAVDVNKCTNEITDRTRSLGNVDMGTGHDNYWLEFWPDLQAGFWMRF